MLRMKSMNYRLLQRRVLRPALLAAALLALAGCSRETGRYSLEGSVTLDGQPLKQGTVSFMPEKGTKGPIAGGDVSEGKFLIAAKGGTFAGKFRVEITATRQAAYKVQSRMTGKMVPAVEQYLPACYNTDSKLQAEVRDSGDNHFTFALKSKGG
jgi:hypothetical protein